MRVMKFSAVGAIGIVVQLALLAGLAHLHLHYLLATAWGVEAAVLHNFCWHQHFTWRDRGICSVWSRLARFHLSNAAISLVGNLVLMRVLVGAFRIQVIAANAVAIAVCAVANYFASEYWVFAASERAVSKTLFSSLSVAGRASVLASVAQREHR